MNLKNTIDVAFVSHQKLTTWHLRNKLLMHWPRHTLTACHRGLLPGPFLLSYSVFVFSFSLFFRFSAVRWPPRQLLSVGLRKSTASYRIVSYHGPTFLLNLVAPYPYTASSVTPFIILTRFKPIPIISSFLSSSSLHYFHRFSVRRHRRVSIHLSVSNNSESYYEMAKRRITQTTPHNIAKEF